MGARPRLRSRNRRACSGFLHDEVRRGSTPRVLAKWRDVDSNGHRTRCGCSNDVLRRKSRNPLALTRLPPSARAAQHADEADGLAPAAYRPVRWADESMSITVDFAFNAPGTLATVQRTVNSAIGVTLGPYEGDADDLFCRFL